MISCIEILIHVGNDYNSKCRMINRKLLTNGEINLYSTKKNKALSSLRWMRLNQWPTLSPLQRNPNS